MGCCGGRYGAGHRAGAAAGSRPATVMFEQRGAGPLTVFGRRTGIRYHFPGPGARVPVDARDAPFLEVIRGLAVVAAAT